jgi:NTP pyrophosphatase (non-canonical NTP hydrolase)
MTPKEYSELALRTANDLGGRLDNIMHAAMGIAGEAGEVIDLVKKTYAYEKPLDDKKLIEEVSDILWYINLLLAVVDRTWEDVFDLNIKKLEARYPDLRFNADHAINRDVDAEQRAMLARALDDQDSTLSAGALR